jgi:hypothetical protein
VIEIEIMERKLTKKIIYLEDVSLIDLVFILDLDFELVWGIYTVTNNTTEHHELASVRAAMH